MSRRDFWICIAVIITIFTLGVMVGMCVQVLGVPAQACAEAREAGGNYQSGMPCENKEQFERWYEDYEQKTEQETSEACVPSEESEGDAEDFDGFRCVFSDQGSVENTAQSAQFDEAQNEIPLYRINGDMIDADIQRKLYKYLSDAGIEYWYTGSLVQMYQESRGQQYAENPNGLDKGLYQYRITYWNWNDGDIFDVDAQLQRYAKEMASRFNAGLSVDEAISRHKTSDHVTVLDWEYIQQVKQWLNKIEKF